MHHCRTTRTSRRQGHDLKPLVSVHLEPQFIFSWIDAWLAEPLYQGSVPNDDFAAPDQQPLLGYYLNRTGQGFRAGTKPGGQRALGEGKLHLTRKATFIDQSQQETGKALGDAAATNVQDMTNSHPPLSTNHSAEVHCDR